MEIRPERVMTHRGERVALVARPTTHVRVGMDRLEELRASLDAGRIDSEILAAARAASDPFFLIFRGSDPDGGGSYAFEETLDDESADELAFLLVRSQLYTYRRLVAAGVMVLMHVDLEVRDVTCFRDATARLRDELVARDASSPLEQLDVWILSHLTFFFSVSYERVLRDTIPAMMPMIERRVPQLAARLEALDPRHLA